MTLTPSPQTREKVQWVVNVTFPASFAIAIIGLAKMFVAPAQAMPSSFSAVQEQRLQAVETLAVGSDKDLRDLKILMLERMGHLQESMARVEAKLER